MQNARADLSYSSDSLANPIARADSSAVTLANQVYQNPKELKSLSKANSNHGERSPQYPVSNAQLLFPSPDSSDSETPAAKTQWKADNSVGHLLHVGTCSFIGGLYEPLAGGAQLAEEVINNVTAKGPITRQKFFAPELLSPDASQEPQAPKYSAEWWVGTIGKNLGMLPDYAMAAVCISKIPGFKDGGSFLSENRILGMNVKTAAASGFTMGALAPINDKPNTSLNDSLKERLTEGSIGAEQMGVMAASTALVGKGYTATERAFTTRGEMFIPGTASEKFLLAKVTSPALSALRKGSIATIGALPAGYSAAYLNARAHGTEFDPTETVVSSAVTAFGFGAIGGGTESVARTTSGHTEIDVKAEALPNSAQNPALPPLRGDAGQVSEKSAGVDLHTGVMEPGNGYVEQLRKRLGNSETTTAPIMWNNSPSLASVLSKADTIITDRADSRVQEAKFRDNPDGVTMVVASPDEVSNVDGGIHYTASFKNNPEGVLQVDDYADGTRWVRQADEDGEESRTAFFPDGSIFNYFHQDAWTLEMLNGNSVVAYPDNIVAREIFENGRVTMVNRTGQIMYTGSER